MGYSQSRATMESRLATAHRALHAAATAAAELGDEHAEDDILQILKEVTRVAEDSLKGRARRREPLSNQMSF